MALADNRLQRISMLCALYLAQGIPWGFMTVALISYLAERGISDAQAGSLTAIVLVPWTFKLVWAPLIDTVTIRSMGRRRPWIILAELLMAVSLLGMLSLGDLTGNLWLLGCMFFIHNCFATLQDVSTDALAVDVLLPGEQGRTNGLMWGSKLIGKAIGAAVMAQAIEWRGLPTAILIQFVALMLIMLFPLLIVERVGEKRFPWSRGEAQDGSSGVSFRNPIDLIKDLIHAFALSTTFVFLVFGTINLIGWGIVEVITKTLYIQQLGWKHVEVSSVLGLAVLPEMAGALAGGYLADRVGRRTVMICGFAGYGLLAIAFGRLPALWHDTWFTTGYLLVNPALLAMGSVGFLSMSMKISWTTSAASMFTIYMTVSNIGHVMGNYLVRPMRDPNLLDLSYEQSFLCAGIVMLLPLLLLVPVRPQSVDERRANPSYKHEARASG